MTPRSRFVRSAAVLFILHSLPAAADEILLRRGGRLFGTIVRQDAREIEISTDGGASVVVLPISAVKQVLRRPLAPPATAPPPGPVPAPSPGPPPSLSPAASTAEKTEPGEPPAPKTARAPSPAGLSPDGSALLRRIQEAVQGGDPSTDNPLTSESLAESLKSKPGGVPALSEVLSASRDEAVIGFALATAELMESPAVAQPIAKLARNPSPALARQAIQTLARLPETEVPAQTLPGLLLCKDRIIRGAAEAALADRHARFPEEDLADPLVELLDRNLESPDAEARLALTKALAGVFSGQPAAAEILARVADSDDAESRHEAIRALSAGGGPAAFDRLETLLRGSADAEVRRACAIALGRGGYRPAAATLIQALDDPDEGVKGAAAQALTSISGSDLGRDRAAWETWLREQPQR